MTEEIEEHSVKINIKGTIQAPKKNEVMFNSDMTVNSFDIKDMAERGLGHHQNSCANQSEVIQQRSIFIGLDLGSQSISETSRDLNINRKTVQ
ncbi:putative TRMT1-like 2, partial [Homarus americanus]